MTKEELLLLFDKNHRKIIEYVCALNDAQFIYSLNNKWTAGQQLNHIYLTLLPFPKILPAKEYLLQKYGKIDRPTWSFETVIQNYYKTSRKAPDQFLPDEITPDQKNAIAKNIQGILVEIESLLEQYSEEELDTLIIPHPLLGRLTIREMFYLMSYHPLHHLRQIEEYLENI